MDLFYISKYFILKTIPLQLTMCSHVSPKTFGIREHLTTLLTLIRLPFVCSLVVVKVTGTTKGFPTVFTFIWLLSSVSGLMVAEGRNVFKGFPTFVTFIKFFFAVAFFVVSKGIDIEISFSTNVTFVRPGSTVSP